MNNAAQDLAGLMRITREEFYRLKQERDTAIGALKKLTDVLEETRALLTRRSDQLAIVEEKLSALEAKAACTLCDGAGERRHPDGDPYDCEACHGGIRCKSPTCKSHDGWHRGYSNGGLR